MTVGDGRLLLLLLLLGLNVDQGLAILLDEKEEVNRILMALTTTPQKTFHLSGTCSGFDDGMPKTR